MPHDPELVAESRAWLLKAGQDVAAADHAFMAEPPFLADIVFHAQQAAEKALKGFLTWNSTPFRKTHSLEELGEQCLSIDPSLAAVIDRAVPLTKYAWKYRYPGDVADPSSAEAADALARAREVLATIRLRLPPEIRP